MCLSCSPSKLWNSQSPHIRNTPIQTVSLHLHCLIFLLFFYLFLSLATITVQLPWFKQESRGFWSLTQQNGLTNNLTLSSSWPLCHNLTPVLTVWVSGGSTWGWSHSVSSVSAHSPRPQTWLHSGTLTGGYSSWRGLEPLLVWPIAKGSVCYGRLYQGHLAPDNMAPRVIRTHKLHNKVTAHGIIAPDVPLRYFLSFDTKKESLPEIYLIVCLWRKPMQTHGEHVNSTHRETLGGQENMFYVNSWINYQN